MSNRRDFLKKASAAIAGSLVLPFTNTFCTTARADVPKTFAGAETFNRLVKLAAEKNWRALPIGERIGAIGLELRGTPYVGSTLELFDDREVCSVNLLGLDCVTFFESALDFARMLDHAENYSPQALMDQVTFTRYRDGKLTDYTSRLHYTADWFFNNEQKHVVKVITRDLPGAVRFTHPVNFMSTHPGSYRQLKANPALIPAIAKIEQTINEREMYYVPKERVADAEPHLMTGDIIGITTTISGIDCSHTGLCYRDNNGLLRYMHASSTKKEVTLDDELAKYLASVSKDTGIMVARPIG
ncbi:MAG TPA: N-acetylmuramoyl-L-alanine amidase-like domain-containing protein [Candidatus Kapabacteria bacterium]|nr:N-acetylmuramoyl-L-alanine amidase-like domain-containing protein [Candidatus Kapabacteria bacterium]